MKRSGSCSEKRSSSLRSLGSMVLGRFSVLPLGLIVSNGLLNEEKSLGMGALIRRFAALGFLIVWTEACTTGWAGASEDWLELEIDRVFDGCTGDEGLSLPSSGSWHQCR